MERCARILRVAATVLFVAALPLAPMLALINAYAQLRARTEPALHIVKRRAVVTLDEAIDRLSRLIGHAVEKLRLVLFRYLIYPTWWRWAYNKRYVGQINSP